MASITLKNLPEELIERLRRRAARERRSVSQQILKMVEDGLDLEEERRRTRDLQLEAWRRLSGRWKTDESMAAESRAIYESRSSRNDPDL